MVSADLSSAKIAPPFVLDPSMRFLSPQDNVAAFDHPRVAAHLAWLRDEWRPPSGRPRIALLLPCTARKPYPVSPEHRVINGALLAAGWVPEPTHMTGTAGDGAPPAALLDVLEPGEDPRLLHTGPLVRDGVELDRIVVSEPLALVPYSVLYDWRGAPSPATAYDDPGLFESRGTSVSPWRDDCTAVDNGDGTWTWGPAEHGAYATAHNTLTDVMVAVLTRVAPAYTAMLAWLASGLTHRSFLGDDALRRAEGLPLAHVGPDGPIDLVGVGDAAPGLVQVLPADEPVEVLVGRLDELTGDLR